MLRRVVIATATCVALSGSAHAQTEFRASSTLGPTHVVAKSFPFIFDKLKELTDGRYTGRDFPSGLVSQNEALTALRDGVIDMGVIVFAFFPSDYAETAVPTELSMASSNLRAVGSAVTEYIATCEPCLAEFKELGQVYTGTMGVPPTQIMSTTPLDQLASFTGKRLRTTGGVFSSWIQAMGGEPVLVPLTDVFENLSQGTIDGTVVSMPDLISQQLQDVIRYITKTDYGVFASNALMATRVPVWESLSQEDRVNLVRAVQYGNVVGYDLWEESSQEAWGIAEASGIEFLEPGDDMRARMKEFYENRLRDLPEVLKARGIEDGKQKLDRYLALLAKWEELLSAREYTHEEFTDLLMQEIWSKVDMKTFGL